VKEGETYSPHLSLDGPPFESFDNWAAVGLLIALGVIAVLLLRKRG
jgi:hypothetical protein